MKIFSIVALSAIELGFIIAYNNRSARAKLVFAVFVASSYLVWGQFPIKADGLAGRSFRGPKRHSQ